MAGSQKDAAVEFSTLISGAFWLYVFMVGFKM